MDKTQQSLCDMVKQKRTCLTDRNILRSALADYLPNNKLQQNLLLNAFDNNLVQNLHNAADVALTVLNCIPQLENDYGISKNAAFWSVQTWCYLLGYDVVADALETLKPTAPNTAGKSVKNVTNTIGLGIYRAGTDFPVGEVSVKIDTPLKEGEIRATYGKNLKRLSGMVDFKDKIYVTLNEGEYLHLESVYGGLDYPAYTFTVTKIN